MKELQSSTHLTHSKRKSHFAGWYYKESGDKYIEHNSKDLRSFGHEKSIESKSGSMKHSNMKVNSSIIFDNNEFGREATTVVEVRESILNGNFSDFDKVSI